MRRSAVVAVAAVVLFPLVPWLMVGDVEQRFTGLPALHSVANISALCGIAAWSANLVLASRARPVEQATGGLEQLYRLHRRVGVLVVVLAVTHVVFLSLHAQGKALELYLPSAGWPTFAGVIALVMLIGSVASSILGHLSYPAFVHVQRLLGVAFLIGALHTFAVAGTAATSPLLRVYLAFLTAAGLAGMGYRVLGSLFGLGRHRYVVDAIRHLDAETVDISMIPEGRELAFRPGQFIYATFHQHGIRKESHPFTIASAPSGSSLRIATKGLGDFTRGLPSLEPGCRVRLEGPFGSFCLRRDLTQPQTWIAGGIGITPFLSWARSLDAAIAADLYYCTPGAEQHHFLAELYEIADRIPEFKVIPMRKSSLGRLSVSDVEAVNPRVARGHVFMCGPPALIDNMTAGFIGRGVSQHHIHSEAFDFR
jgi:predicted ferric reductase